MTVRLHPHAQARLMQRGATEAEVMATVESGKVQPVKFGRTEFTRVFAFNSDWNGNHYANKRVHVIATMDAGDWIVITVIVKFF